MQDPQVTLVRQAVDGQSAALRELFDVITPAIHRSVAATLRRRVSSRAQSRVRHEVEDLAQEVLVALFADGGRRLLLWDPERGLPLPRFVELVSRHLVESFLRRRERRVWEDKPIDGDELDGLPDLSESPELLAEHKELLLAVLAAVEVELTPDAREVFRMLVVEGRSVADVRAHTGLSENAVHLKRHRIVKIAEAAASRIRRGDAADG